MSKQMIEPTETRHADLTTRTLTDSLFEAVRSRIINEDIPQGARLTEVQLINEYQVSRPTAWPKPTLSRTWPS
ncbi:MAG: hypothetical protein LBD70_07170 [Bifidobacteriaceae bacterium]|nr:hypothetical protein [Bifidobacteriaceae bacterium]